MVLSIILTKNCIIWKVWLTGRPLILILCWDETGSITNMFLIADTNMHSNIRNVNVNWAASSEFGTYRLCEQGRFRRVCASAQSRQNLRCSLIQAVSQEEPSDRKPDPWPLWLAGHAQLKFVMTECSKTQILLTRPNWSLLVGGSPPTR